MLSLSSPVLAQAHRQADEFLARARADDQPRQRWPWFPVREQPTADDYATAELWSHEPGRTPWDELPPVGRWHRANLAKRARERAERSTG